jgi:hypothetical protein
VRRGGRDGAEVAAEAERAEGYDVGAISPDKRYLALGKNNTTSDTDIFLYDRQTKKTTHITPHEGSVINSAQDFTPDGTALVYLSDEGREFASLRKYDLAAGTKTPILEPQWDIAGAGYSKLGKYLLVTINEDAKLTSHVYDAATLQEVPMPGLPAGLVRGMRFSRDETMYGFYNSDGSAPDDLWIGVMGQAPHRVTDGLNPTIQRADLVVVPGRDLHHRSAAFQSAVQRPGKGAPAVIGDLEHDVDRVHSVDIFWVGKYFVIVVAAGLKAAHALPARSAIARAKESAFGVRRLGDRVDDARIGR